MHFCISSHNLSLRVIGHKAFCISSHNLNLAIIGHKVFCISYYNLSQVIGHKAFCISSHDVEIYDVIFNRKLLYISSDDCYYGYVIIRPVIRGLIWL